MVVPMVQVLGDLAQDIDIYIYRYVFKEFITFAQDLDKVCVCVCVCVCIWITVEATIVLLTESLQNKDDSLLGRLKDVYVNSATESVQVVCCIASSLIN